MQENSKTEWRDKEDVIQKEKKNIHVNSNVNSEQYRVNSNVNSEIGIF